MRWSRGSSVLRLVVPMAAVLWVGDSPAFAQEVEALAPPLGGAEAPAQPASTAEVRWAGAPGDALSDLGLRVAWSAEPWTDPRQPEVVVYVRNLQGVERALVLPARIGSQFVWKLTNAQGAELTGSFLPPPMPLPDDHPAMQIRLTLKGGEEREALRLAGPRLDAAPEPGVCTLRLRGPLLGETRGEIVFPPLEHVAPR